MTDPKYMAMEIGQLWNECEAKDEQIEALEAQLQACRVERDAALYQLRAQHEIAEDQRG